MWLPTSWLRAPGFKGFRHIPLGPCSGFKAKRRGFSILFSSFFLFSFFFLLFLLFLEDSLAFYLWGSLTYYKLSMKLGWVLQCLGGRQFFSLLLKPNVHCVWLARGGRKRSKATIIQLINHPLYKYAISSNNFQFAAFIQLIF